MFDEENDQVLAPEADEQPGVSAKPEQKPETITISKAEYARLERERDEAKEGEKFWSDRARGAGKETAAAQDEEEPGVDISDLVPKVTGEADVDEAIFSDPEKWLEAIAKGPGAISKLLKKEGYVNAQEVAEIAAKVANRTVQVERAKITTDNRLMTAFPALADNKSDLFKATAEEYKTLVEFDPEAKKSPATLFAAARAAEAKLKADSKSRKAAEDDEDEDIYDRVEVSRRNRIAAQDGSRGGRGSRGEEPDSGLGPQALQIAKMMGITPDEMIAERRKMDTGRRRR